MERVPEPELMEELEQAKAYAGADFEEPHARVIELFDAQFPGAEINGRILDLGCGPGDVSFRFARRFPGAEIMGIDGSAAMIALAEERRMREPLIAGRLTFIRGLLQSGAAVPPGPYEVILSTSLLHHLHSPGDLWEVVRRYASPGTKIFVVDLLRPLNPGRAREIVEKYCGGEPEVLKRDFYQSLLAAFEPAEVREQLREAGLPELSVRVVSDRHFMVHGVRRSADHQAAAERTE